MIDAAAIRAGRMRSDPFRWTTLGSVVPGDAAADLARTFPADGFVESARDGETKSYQLAARPIASQATLPEPWSLLVQGLRSDDYRVALEQLSGVSLAGVEPELTLWRYGPGCWLSPHVDKPDKILTHLFYFNPGWQRDWGGCLRILRSSEIDDVVDEVVPLAGESVVLVRSDASWHAVLPVGVERAGRRVRTSLTAIFSRGPSGGAC